MIGNKAANLFIDCTTKRQKNTRLRVCLNDTKYKQVHELITDGRYYLKYRPFKNQPLKSNKAIHAQIPFFILADIFTNDKHRFKDFEDMKRIAEADDKFRFLLEWTNINESMFELAEENPGTPIPFCFDAVRYRNHIKELSGADKLYGLFWEEHER